MLKGTQEGANARCSIIRKDSHCGWQVRVQAILCISDPCLKSAQTYKSLQRYHLSSFSNYFYFKKSFFSSYQRKSRQTSSAAVYSLNIVFKLTASHRNDTDENIRCKILAGCCCITAGMKRACCHVWSRSFKKWKYVAISTHLRIKVSKIIIPVVSFHF